MCSTYGNDRVSQTALKIILFSIIYIAIQYTVVKLEIVIFMWQILIITFRSFRVRIQGWNLFWNHQIFSSLSLLHLTKKFDRILTCKASILAGKSGQCPCFWRQYYSEPTRIWLWHIAKLGTWIITKAKHGF